MCRERRPGKCGDNKGLISPTFFRPIAGLPGLLALLMVGCGSDRLPQPDSWELEQPDSGYSSDTQPATSDSSPSLDMSAVSVDVDIDSGEPPPSQLLILLSWENPEDPEKDGVGSDLDLHVVKMDQGRWFEAPYDVYFRNPTASWDPENVTFTTDDRGGHGPEAVRLDDGGNCGWYAVGVHYYSKLFGTADFDLAVFVDGTKAYELSGKLSTEGQFFDALRIQLPSATVLEAGIEFDAAPVGEPPPVTTGMAETGLCDGQML